MASRLGIGNIENLEGISDGVVNTNYRLTTSSRQYVLTLVEDPAEADALPFVAGLLSHLAQNNIPCPQPISDSAGTTHFSIKNRPALLATFLQGKSPKEPTAAQCQAIGKILATIHLASQNFTKTRPNPMGQKKWLELLAKIGPKLKKTAPKTLTMLLDESQWLQNNYHDLKLPTGICHADLFPDNSFFIGEKLTGIIDFFFACQERYIYDLAVARNAWCFNPNGHPIPTHWPQLLAGYTTIRPLLPLESQHLTTAARAAALRFTLSRLHDNFFPRPGETVTKKPPQPFITRLEYFRGL